MKKCDGNFSANSLVNTVCFSQFLLVETSNFTSNNFTKWNWIWTLIGLQFDHGVLKILSFAYLFIVACVLLESN